MVDIYDPDCRKCKLWEHADEICEPGFLPFPKKKPTIFVVSRLPNSDKYQDMLEAELIEAGVDISEVFFTAAIKCRNWVQNIGRKDLKACSEYLKLEIEQYKPKWILCFGNEALQAVTGHSGIMKYRGRVMDHGSYKVVATLSPAAITRNPGQRQSWQSDLLFFTSQIAGRSARVGQPEIHVIHTPERLVELKDTLEDSVLISYDVETTGFDEFGKSAAIVSLAGTCVLTSGDLYTWVLPLYHPGSPFKTTWVACLDYIKKSFEGVPKQIAHNGKFDARWLRQFGIEATVTFDTLLAAHLLDENRLKGLKPLARMLLGVSDWAITTTDLLHTPLKQVLKYNALDVWYTYHIYLLLRKELISQPRLLRLFMKLIMPANNILIEVERRGVWIDKEKLANAVKVAFDMRDHIDAELMTWVPDRSEIDNWPTNSKGKPVEVNFNASNFARWWLFDYLGMPTLERGKDKDDGRIGDPSMREAVMMELKETGHPAITLLLERVKWQKYCSSFVVPYQELADEHSRLHTNFKLAGTVTGRLSSGKTDQEKVTATRGKNKIRGVNLQQVPRDPFIRGLFGAPPGWWFVEADFSQVELRVIAFVARERTLLGIYARGEDVHLNTAMIMTGKPASQISKDDRKKAKPVNFGYAYGMGWRKFIKTAWENYGIHFSEEEAQASRRAYFDTYSGLYPWHARQRRLVRENGRVMSPLGRIRHLPDIHSKDEFVQGEAERQAINSPIQSFASDMNLLSMVILDDKFKQLDLKAHTLGLVHDAINFEVHESDLCVVLPMIKRTMENLPLEQKFGISIDVPIIADLKIGTHWGEAKEIDPDHIRGSKAWKRHEHEYLAPF